MLVNGKWSAAWTPVQSKDAAGRFVRQTSSFRHWVTADGSAGPTGDAGYKAEPGRYHLYVALICPWASRALMVRKLKKLDEAISTTVVEPLLSDQGWRFGDYPGAGRDPHLGATYMHEIYTHSDAGYTGRATVPVLWDKAQRRIVNNESADILRMLNSAFDAFGDADVDLYPTEHAAEIDALNPVLYDRLNNGVYKAGFASSQAAYEEAVAGVFETLGALEDQLSDGRPYLFGPRITETDIRLFVSLARFDAAYHGLFKCNLKRLADYPHLSAYAERVFSLPGVRATVDLDHIKAGYYSIKALNPSGIVPLGPLQTLAPNERAAAYPPPGRTMTCPPTRITMTGELKGNTRRQRPRQRRRHSHDGAARASLGGSVAYGRLCAPCELLNRTAAPWRISSRRCLRAPIPRRKIGRRAPTSQRSIVAPNAA